MGIISIVPRLLYSSLMAGILVALITFVRRMFKSRLGARWQYLVWFFLILKLSIPYAPESSFSIFNVFNKITLQILAGNYLDVHGTDGLGPDEEGKSVATAEGNFSNDYSLSVNRNVTYSSNAVLFSVWVFGVLGVFGYTVFVSFSVLSTVQETVPIKDRRILNLFEECKRLTNIKTNCVLVESPAIRSPMLVGAIRPHILLPAGITADMSMMALKFALLHELAHIKQKDLYVNLILCFLQAIHWFNPLIWYAFRLIRQDMELACDARVLSILEPHEYKGYGAAIIYFLERYSHPPYTMTGMIDGKTRIKERIAKIAHYKKETPKGVMARALLFLLIGCLVLTDSKEISGLPPASRAPGLQPDVSYEDLSNYFHPFRGSFVCLDLARGHYGVYNAQNSQRRVSPDSTYKIISSLIGLETGALPGENAEFKWDGTVYPFESWNKNQTLSSAMADSVSWFFQKIDSAVGKQRIGEYLKLIGYGNQDISAGIKDFWLESSLKISLMEQVSVLKKLYTYDMPFSRANIDTIKKTLKLSEQDGVILSGKTGTGVVNGRGINGWFVGYVENRGNVFIFSANIRGKEGVDGSKARNIVISILKDKRIL